MDETTPHMKYLLFANAALSLQNKNVLEVGGCTPPEILKTYNPKSWTCINLNSEAVSQFNGDAHAMGMKEYIACHESISNFRKSEKKKNYDVIYSINCFEHIQELENAFTAMYQALNPGGLLFTIFGPIWSSDVGHHLHVSSDKGEVLHFMDNILAPWEHLTSTPENLLSKLESMYDRPTAERAVEYIYTYHDLNRLYEHEYFKIVDNSGFSPILTLKRKFGIAPPIRDATSTRELLFVLKKGRVYPWEKAICLAKIGITYIRNH